MSLKKNLEKSFKDYAGMTIMDRAIVDVRDFLKPSARVSLYAQYIEKILPTKPHQKSLKSVAAAMTHFYTHGDASLYSLLARMGKPWAMRYVLEDFQGITGTVEESDSQASARYTEMRLAPLSMSLFSQIDKNTISKWYNNYDDTEVYPAVLPSLGFYNIVNGTMGIATAIASSVPQFNLREVNTALIKLLWDRHTPIEELICLPDFATGATLLNREDVIESLKVGNGKSCKLRSSVHYDAKERVLIVTEIPYGVYTSTLNGQILKLIESEKNPGIDRFLDLSGQTPLIKIYLTKSANPDKVLKVLFKETSLEYHFGINMVMLDKGSIPKVFNWKEALSAHLDHEISVYRKAYEFDKKKLESRLHIVEGLIRVVPLVDTIIAIVRAADSTADAAVEIQKLGFSTLQTKAILDIKLGGLVKLEINKLIREESDLRNAIAHIAEILQNEKLLFSEVEKGLQNIMTKYGDDRRTRVLDLKLDEDEEPTEIRQLMISLTNKNNLMTQEISTLYAQKKGGVGSKLKLDPDEYISSSIVTQTDELILLYSQSGNSYTIAAKNLNLNEKISLFATLDMPLSEKIKEVSATGNNNEDKFIFFVTKRGTFKKTSASEYNSKRKGGVKAILLEPGDEIVSVMMVKDEKIGVLSRAGNIILIDSKTINPTGRSTKGVAGMKLDDLDEVVSARIVSNNTKEILTASEAGLVKKTLISEFSVTGRNTKGVKAQKLTSDRMGDFMPIQDEKEIILVASSSQIRISLSEVPLLGRATMGNRLMKLKENDRIKSILKI